MNASVQKVAEGLEMVADGLAEIAHQLRAIDAGAAPRPEPLPFADDFTVPGAAAVPPPAAPVQAPVQEYGHEAVCPKHRIPYAVGRSGSRYCSAKSDEEGWTSQKGYCQITPKSAAAWLAQHAGR
jgi:hypothetical protein